ncbi:MAG: AAA family ATPase [Chloroflexi bacterium]|nr:AAA family ATPase [Chloroflexota bacterium]
MRASSPALFSGPVLIGGRYRLHNSLGKGGMGRVYRASDRLTGQQLALKRVLASDELLATSYGDSSYDPRLALAREFQALASLRHPNIIGVLDYGFDAERQPYFTMDLLENARTIVEAGRNQSRAVQLSLIVQLLQALAYLHRRGIVHRDLKPGNVLVPISSRQANGREMVEPGAVRVLDFGLSVTIDQATGTVGTLNYMAPEVLRSQPAGPPSDLYAVGILACELLAGQHPFYDRDTVTIIDRILNHPPNLASLDAEPELQAVLLRLLAKEAGRRYASALDVIQALAAVADLPAAVETVATRESFLQAARFVGRQAEMEQLTDALAQALEGRGSSWLVAGESGVGKSRLVDELRIRALVRGALVLRGQTVRGGGSPYAIWRTGIRRLVLHTELNDFQAGVLKLLVPDIETLLERHVPDAPVLDAQTAQNRLLATVAGVIRSQERPLVILLEDLQWAEAESLELLARLNRIAPQLPLLLVTNYRDDERPDLPALLPGMRKLKLERLGDDAIADLSESMLGPAGQQSQVLELLQRETEGNPFFLVEVVRALAEEAGQLERVGSKTLPAQVFTGGLQQLVERRLNQVPAGNQPLLQLAAAAGRVLNLKVLRAADPGANLEQWLTNCANAAVLNVQDERWQFAHDKLRERLLARLTEPERRNLYRRVALAFETIYASAPERAATLAYFWAQAGDAGQELKYAAVAGQYALQSGANHEAVEFFSRALGIRQQLDPARLVPPDAAEQLEQARWLRQLGEAHLGLGQLGESRAALLSMLSLVGRPVPASQLWLLTSLQGQLLAQLAHRAWPSRFLGRASAEEATVLLEAARAYEKLAEIYYFANERTLTLNAGLTVLNLSERAGPSPELARSYATMSVITGLIPWQAAADAYINRALQTARQVGDLPALAWVLLLAGTYEIGLGRWQKVVETANQAIELCRQLGDQRLLGFNIGLLTLVAAHQGKFEESRRLYAEWYETAYNSDNIQHQALSLFGQAESLLPISRDFDQVKNLANKGLTLLIERTARTVENRTDEIRGHGALALASLRSGEPQPARLAADEAMNIILQLSAPTRVTVLEGLSGMAEVYLSLWEAGDTTTISTIMPSLAAAAKKACQVMGQFARVFVVGRPRACLWQGRYEWLANRPRQAAARWQKGLALAERLAMPYDQALLHLEIGRRAAGAEPQTHLAQAGQLLEKLETVYHLEQARASLTTTL